MSFVGLVPDVGLAFGDVDLAERERHERDVPVGAGPRGREHVLVRVAGEGAAVVAGDGEGPGGHVSDVTSGSNPSPGNTMQAPCVTAARLPSTMPKQ